MLRLGRHCETPTPQRQPVLRPRLTLALTPTLIATAMTTPVAINRPAVALAIGTVLKYIDADSGREGLWQTPDRVAEMYAELFAGVGQDPGAEIDAVFTDEVASDPVLVRDLPFYSMCEHHLLPFFGHARLAYLPDGRIAGISKIARALDMAARRLQVQERLTAQLADAVLERVRPRIVACRLEAEHLCMSMRGVQKPGHRVVTTAVRVKPDAQTEKRCGDRLWSSESLLKMLAD